MDRYGRKHTNGVLRKLRVEGVRVGKDSPKKIRKALGHTALPKANIRAAMKYRKIVKKRMRKKKK